MMRDRIVLGLLAIAVAFVMLGWMIFNPWFPPMTATPVRTVPTPARTPTPTAALAPAYTLSWN